MSKATERRVKLMDTSALLSENDQEYIIGYMQAMVDFKLIPKKIRKKKEAK